MPLKHRIAVLAVWFLLSASLFAAPVVTSITPDHGPLRGGTPVTIKGSGFLGLCSQCPRLSVAFGFQSATFVNLVNDNTIVAVTPPNLSPGPVTATIQDIIAFPGSTVINVANAFTYEGEFLQEFERILFPIFLPPVDGAFGSEFRTEARVWNTQPQALWLFGLDTNCTLIDPPFEEEFPYGVGHLTEDWQLDPVCSRSTGRFFYVPRQSGEFLAASLRVFETSKHAQNHGVEIPVVREDDFQDQITLLGVPLDPKFRLTLRIYGINLGVDVLKVRIGDEVHLLPFPKSGDRFVPNMITFTDFPLPKPGGDGTARVTISAPGIFAVVSPQSTPIWAFIAVTNNDTQHITTITPN